MVDVSNRENYVYYRAKGRSLEAVEQIRPDYAALQPSRYTDAVLEGLETLGILKPTAVQIYLGENAYPRPYLVAPQVYELPFTGGIKEYVVEVPVDHRGDHTPPPDAEKLSAKEAAYVKSYLAHGGGWADPLPLNDVLGLKPRFGTYMPSDYDARTSQHVAVAPAFSGGSETRYYRAPVDMTNKLRQFFKKAEQGGTAAVQNDPLFKMLVADDGKTLPQFSDFKAASYLVYRNVKSYVQLPIDRNRDLGQIEYAQQQEDALKRIFGDPDYDAGIVAAVESAKRVDLAEYYWVAADDFDRQIGIRPPLDPPPALDELYCDTVFRAEGRSKAVLDELLRAEKDLYKNQKALELILFGEPDVTNTFNVAGHSFSTYKSKFHPEYEDGKIVGIRCDWTPLHPHYQGMENIEPPEDWVEVKKRPGVYAPGKDAPEEQKKLFARLSYPDYKSCEDVFGKDPIIGVRKEKDAYPRAYREYPFVHALRDRFLIESPADYKGNVFRPTESARLSKKEYYDFRSMCGDMYEPHMMLRHEGVPLPDDYVYQRPDNDRAERRYFLPAGQSEKIYQDYLKEKSKVSKLREDFIKAVGGSGSYGFSMSGEMHHVEFSEKVPENWLKQSQHRASQMDDDGKIYDVLKFDCVPDESTDEGRKFAKKMRSFPAEPTQDDLQQRLGVTQGKLRLDDYNGRTLFRIDADGKTGALTPPPGAIELPSSIIQWQQADMMDKRCGIKPPPMPPELKEDIAEFQKKIESCAKKAPPKKQGRGKGRGKGNKP